MEQNSWEDLFCNWFKVIRALNSLLNEKPFMYLHRGSNFLLYFYIIDSIFQFSLKLSKELSSSQAQEL